MMRLNRLHAILTNSSLFQSQLRLHTVQPNHNHYRACNHLSQYAVAALGATLGLLSANVVFADRSQQSTHLTDDAPHSTSHPSRESYKYLICGGGVAAQEAVKVFVEEKESAGLLVVSPEWRTSLPPLTSDKQTDEPPQTSPDTTPTSEDSGLQRVFQAVSSLSLWSSSPETDDNVETGSAEIVLGRKVTKIDTQLRIATLDDGTNISFEKVLIAIGSAVPKIPMGRLVSLDAARFVGTAQSAADWAAISKIFSEHSGKSPHFTVVGGDWLTAIVGARLIRLGASVTFAYADPCFLARCLPKYVGRDVRDRLEWLAYEQAGVDLLSYSAIRFITARPPLSRHQHQQLPPPSNHATLALVDDSEYKHLPAKQHLMEAEVHAGSVFDAFSIVDFRTDCVLFVPTGGNVEDIDVSGVTTIPAQNYSQGPTGSLGSYKGSTISNVNESNSGIISTNSQLSAASDVYVAGAATGRWGAAHAAQTGRHAAHNMLGARQALELGPERMFINLSDINVGVTTIGKVDGSSESFGYFSSDRRISRTMESDTDEAEDTDGCCGGRLVRGVVFCLSGAPPRFRGDGLRLVVTGIALWNGVPHTDRRALRDVEEAASHAEQIVQMAPMTRSDLERVMDAYVRKFADITDFEEVVLSKPSEPQSPTNVRVESVSDDTKSAAENNPSNDDADHDRRRPLVSKRPVPGVIWKRHLPARRVALRRDELLWVDNDWVGAASPTNQNDVKAQAYSDLLRRSAGGQP